MKITEFEMRGLLSGKCIPGDMKVNEQLPAYLVRKFSDLHEQLTATTNSLTNAQEALKSAGIEADTVQAGVMELKTRLEALAVENDLIHSNPSLASMMDALDKFYEHEHLPETGMLAAYKTLLPKRSPATEACLNAVRAEGAIAVRNALVVSDDGSDIYAIATEVFDQLRAGNAGKDGV